VRERTNFPDSIAEAALAHAAGSKVVQAYARGDLFDKRRRLMEAWAQFCADGKTLSKVISLHANA
jgi:hypothetical protein